MDVEISTKCPGNFREMFWNWPGNVQELSLKVKGITRLSQPLHGICAEIEVVVKVFDVFLNMLTLGRISGKKSWKFLGNFQECSWKCPGNSQELTGKSPGNVREMSGIVSGNVLEIIGKCHRIFPDISLTFPGHFWKNPGFFPEMCSFFFWS